MSNPLFDDPEPGQSPADRDVPEGHHPWSPTALTGAGWIGREQPSCGEDVDDYSMCLCGREAGHE